MLITLFSQNFIQIYGQSAIFCLFVRKQNSFYGQTAIYQWFVRKFLAIMMGIYGQTAIFAHFVRNRHFSERPFTDKFPIFIDVSVIGSDFPNAVPDESARQALRPIFRQIISGYFRHGRQSSCMRKKPDQICNWAQSIRGFNWNIIFPNFLSVWGKFFSSSIANQNAKSLDFRHLFFAKAW